MKKYFKEEQSKKISLLEYLLKFEKQDELHIDYKKIKHIYSSLGDVQIREDMIDTFLETFDSSKCRYGTICFKPETIQGMYQISEMFPELSKEALLAIKKEYIKDLFDKYSLVETLAIMLRKDGMEDSTFEKFMSKVLELADKEESKYRYDASWIRIFCGQYTYDFVTHFEKFIKQHHISWQRFCECMPSPEIIFKDQLELKILSSESKDCWGTCMPITFQMLEDYLDGDIELSSYEKQPSYYISTSGRKVPTSFTKQEFLESIKKDKEKQKIRK